MVGDHIMVGRQSATGTRSAQRVPVSGRHPARLPTRGTSMIAVTDFVGISTLVTAIGAIIIGIVVALRQTNTIARVQTIKDAVTTSNGATLADLAEQNQAHNERTDQPPPVVPTPPADGAT